MIKFLKQKNKACPQRLAKHGGRGFTLVETLIAISIFSVSIVALMSFLSQNISNAGYAKKKIIATYLAQEGIESVRNMRDSYIFYSDTTSNDWNKFKVKLNPCNLGNECGFNNSVYTDNPNFIFKCSSNPNGCKLYLNDGNYNTNSVGNDSGYSRKIRMDTISADEVKVFSTVSWSQPGGLPYTITLSESLFNWVE